MKTLKLLFSSLYKNDSCIEGGRTKPWYFAIIFAVLSLILAVLPITITQLNTSGAGFISSNTYGYEIGLTRFTESIYNNDIHLVVKEDENGKHYLECEKKDGQTANQWEITYKDNIAKRFEHRIDAANPDSSIDFCAYYTELSGNDFTNYVTRITNGVDPTTGDPLEGRNVSQYTHFVVFGKYQVQSVLYKPNTTTANGSVRGDYEHINVGYDLNYLAVVRIGEYTFTPASTGNEYALFMSGSFNLWKDFFYSSYITNRNTATWQTSLLMLGIDALLILFMGLMVFILTRGKKNPFRIITFWETQKIAYWASFTPALLALILGFIFSSYAVMIFILILGVRIMWMSMKSLRPAQ